jgi:hypothetical protein
LIIITLAHHQIITLAHQKLAHLLMTEFQAFFQLGFEHIVALDGIDHVLFIIVLAAVYEVKMWRKILILVTAFTIGHSLTLILAALNVISFSPKLIELLIPVTIFVTALFNLYEKPAHIENKPSVLGFRYFLAGFFGLIHGFAFSNSPRSIFALSRDNIVGKLFAFNLGIEVGQIIAVIMFLILAFVITQDSKQKQLYWNIALSSIALLVSTWLFWEKLQA